MLIGGAVLSIWSNIFSYDPKSALSDFYGGAARPECLLTEPLRRAGDSILPLLLAEVRDKAMPKRRYAIGYLGERRYEAALPVLEAILRDDTERDFVRGDALLAIYAISEPRAKLLAADHQHHAGHLNRIVGEIVTDGRIAKAAGETPSCG